MDLKIELKIELKLKIANQCARSLVECFKGGYGKF